MTYIPDLAPCDYFSFFEIERVRAVGWLDAIHPFPKGRVARRTLRRLRLIAKTWPYWDSLGVHLCEVCPPAVHHATGFLGRWRARHARGGANVFVPGPGIVYAAPFLILHYIASHQYLPPQEFLEAVGACPLEPDAYWRAVIANGPDTFRVYFENRAVAT